MASLSCRISPRTSTVIFLDKSPLATAMVTPAMLRTCAVKLPAIWLTESVSSFHTPDTALTLAWPPSLPSVPTSRATRVTSEVKTANCSIIVFTSFAERRNSPSSERPSTSSSINCPRSPLVTAPIVRAISIVGLTSASSRELKQSTLSAHPTVAPGTDMRSMSRPSRPTVPLNRSISRESRSSSEMVWLKAAAICPAIPPQSDGNRTEKSPSRNANIAVSICVDWASTEPSSAALFTLADLPRSTFGLWADLLEFGIMVFVMVCRAMTHLNGYFQPAFVLIAPCSARRAAGHYPEIGPYLALYKILKALVGNLHYHCGRPP